MAPNRFVTGSLPRRQWSLNNGAPAVFRCKQGFLSLASCVRARAAVWSPLIISKPEERL